MEEREVTGLIRKYVLKNAMEYGGTANVASVLGKVLSKEPELKGDIPGLKEKIGAEIARVAGIGKGEAEREYREYVAEFESEDKARADASARHNFELEGAVRGDFAIRFAPEPSSFMHIGHAKAAFLAREVANQYGGRNYLYFDDTNPEKESQEFVDSIKDSLSWLGITFDDEYYASDYIEDMYGYARRLIEERKAYMCMCNADRIKELRFKGEACSHRSETPAENLEGFEKMVRGDFDEGEAILRFVGKMESDNTSMRDPMIMRIKKTGHYRKGKKYVVWPSYDFNTPIMDSTHGITDILRTKEYELRDELYVAMLEALRLRIPRTHIQARLKIKNNVTSKREIKGMIERGEIEGYSDPRLVTISALRARGISPIAIKNFVLRFGINRTDSIVDISLLLSENKKVVDPTSKRLFYVEDPVKVVVEGLKNSEIKLKLHPTQEIGYRSYIVGETFYISSSDAGQLKKGDTLRLKEAAAIKITDIRSGTIFAEKIDGAGEGIMNVQWVSEGNLVDCTIKIPGDLLDSEGKFNANSMKISTGYVESYAKELGEGEVVQFERFGFSTFHRKSDPLVFIYLSK